MTSTFARTVLALGLSLFVGGIPAAHAQEAPAAKPSSRRAAAVTASPASPVNLNTATAAELEGLPGIGPRAAQRIVEYRAKNGAFKKIEELMKVQGIGERSFLRLKPLLSVAAPKADGKGPQ